MSDDSPSRYDPAFIEPKWQRNWDERSTFRSERHAGRKKLYVLDMFPYPSGSGLHVGHPEGYTATDIVARYARMRGVDVLHPMGWDAFGLPAEQHAIQTGELPRDTTKRNIATFKRQLKMLGFSYDWSREIDTTDPGYVRWTQWIFLKLFERGLAYQAEIPVNWCPELGTVLSNEEVVDGKSERGGHPVQRLPLRQWMLRITAYADRLDADLEQLNWPDTKAKQHYWIGRAKAPRSTSRWSGRATRSGSSRRVRTRVAGSHLCRHRAGACPRCQAGHGPSPEQRVCLCRGDAQSKSDPGSYWRPRRRPASRYGAKARNPVTGQEVPICSPTT